MLSLQKIRSNIVYVNEPLSNEESHTSKRISTNEGSGQKFVREIALTRPQQVRKSILKS